jgi:biopolymer transport protein ExbD
MSSGGMIVRFIDIVMILLFGFICSSELSRQSKIRLPTTLELPPSNPDPEVVVFVGVQNDGSYLIEEEKARTKDPGLLEHYLLNKKNELAQTRYKMRVRVRANHDTPIRFVMKAADVCDRIDVLKSVDVRIGSKVKR